ATVRAMVGPEDFRQLARAFWGAHPPQRGDLGEWGEAFPAWLQAHADLAAWPYLGDCARLDLALHRNERAADAALDAASLTLLESSDPARLHLQLMPGTALLRSAWPVVSIHRAHQLDAAAADRAWAAVRAAIAARVGEDALVVREGWRAVVHPLSDVEARWTDRLLHGANLDASLAEAGESFDFAAWLQTAVRRQWLSTVVVTGA
ncbi:MAG: putative DNA-binding domain-containing protein, partial [Rhizobacter sp.]